MRLITTVALAGALTFGFVACGDDNGDPSPTDTSTTDTSTTDTSTTDTGTDTAEPPDPCDPNPCTVAPAPICNTEGDAVITFTAPGTCADDNGVASCAYDQTSTDCGQDEVCVNGACFDNPSEFTPASSASYVSAMEVGDQSCCDQTGDGQPNNKLGALLGLLGNVGLDFDVNEAIADAIEAGSLTILFDFPNADGANDVSELIVRGYVGDSEDDHATRIAGNGSFTVSPASFVTGTFITQILMMGAIDDGGFTAGPSSFDLIIDITDIGTLTLRLENTRLDSTVTVGANGAGLNHTGGKLSGLVPFAQFVDTFNELAADCDCFGLAAGQVPFRLTTVSNAHALGCTAEFQAATPSCSASADGALCDGLGSNKGLVCSAGSALLNADIDTTFDGVRDAMSAYLTYTAVSATITGVTPQE